LAELLANPQLSTSAGNALEAIPGTAPSEALRNNLVKVSGAQKIGVINLLAARRDPGSVSLLAALMKDESLDISGAATAALGEIATIKAAQELHKFLPHAPQMLRRQGADAALVCAERLIAQGDENDAKVLYQMLIGLPIAARFKDAAGKGLQGCTAQR
jgi:HEAT repeat protein